MGTSKKFNISDMIPSTVTMKSNRFQYEEKYLENPRPSNFNDASTV
jgi:hypothetical protein